MGISDLPIELISLILKEAIHVRKVNRGLRLRLVSKIFDKEVVKVLFISRLLDPRFDWTYARYGCLPPIGVAYLEHRVLTEPSNGNATILHIHRVAERLHLESSGELNMRQLIDRLCRRVMEHGQLYQLGIWAGNGDITRLDFETDVYVAAVHTQNIPIIENWLASGKTGREVSWLFGRGMSVAAEYGNHELLAAIMSRGPGSDLRLLRSQVLEKVVTAGRLNATRFVFNFATDRYPWECYDPSTDAARLRRDQQLHHLVAPSQEIFHFIRKKQKEYCFNWKHGQSQFANLLRRSARQGWMEMVTYLLKIEPRISFHTCDALYFSCLHGNEEMVRLLLAHHSCTCIAPCSRHLGIATERCHIAIVRILLDHGFEHGNTINTAAKQGYGVVLEALLNDRKYDTHSLQPLLVSAIEREHEAMFRLLISRGVDPKDAETSAKCIKVAKEKGLESMLDLLAAFGVGGADRACNNFS